MYIIDKADIFFEEEQNVKKQSLFIKNNTIHSIKTDFVKTALMRMNVSSFIMTPTHVMLDSDIPVSTFQIQKKYFTTNFLLKGCHTIITPFTIQNEWKFDQELHKKRVSLLNSPVDYVLAVKLPLEKLSTNIIRKCKKGKIAIIFCEIHDESSLSQIPWGWIREAMFPYNPILVPIYLVNDHSKKKAILKKWNDILGYEKIPSLSDEMPKKTPISVKNLKKFGLYPKRGDLHIGGEINYNLYFKNKKVAEQKGIHYDNDRLAIMVHKGRVTTTLNTTKFRPGFGEEIVINGTSLFV
ncbi:hypothetical protein ACQKP0_07140 [Heyndrickxia sp. NPDC080065]|uniref:hypothetical protein n=1 Tax=Heyndrickxia sp. NPDC080065 TaxID=3390568 RepID=UPI003D015695